jgi:histone demethylase JARID1
VALSLTIEEAEKCQTVANQLGSKKVRTRTRVVDAKYRLTVEELELFSNQLQTLPVKVQGHKAVEDLLKQVQEFKEGAHKLLARDISGKKLADGKKPDKTKGEDKEGEDESDVEELSKDILKCIETGLNLDVDLEEMTELKIRQKQVDWLVEVEEFLEGEEIP